MSKPTAQTGRLLLFVEEFAREPTSDIDIEYLRLQLHVKNPIGSPGDAEWLPPAEVRDNLGRVAEVQPDDTWAQPIEPGEELTTRPYFPVYVDATDLVLVFGPGTDDEVRVELVGE